MLLAIKALIEALVLNLVWVYIFKQDNVFLGFAVASMIVDYASFYMGYRKDKKMLTERDNCHILKFIDYQHFRVLNDDWYVGRARKRTHKLELAVGEVYNGEGARALRLIKTAYDGTHNNRRSKVLECFNTEKAMITAYIMVGEAITVVYGSVNSLERFADSECLTEGDKEYIHKESEIAVARVAAVFDKHTEINTKLYEAFNYHTKPIDKVQDAYWYLVGTSEGDLTYTEKEIRAQMKKYIAQFGFDTVFAKYVKVGALNRKDED